MGVHRQFCRQCPSFCLVLPPLLIVQCPKIGLCYGSLPGRRLKSFNDTCPGLEDIVKEIKSNKHVLRLRHTSCLSSRKHKSNPALFMQYHSFSAGTAF